MLLLVAVSRCEVHCVLIACSSKVVVNLRLSSTSFPLASSAEWHGRARVHSDAAGGWTLRRLARIGYNFWSVAMAPFVCDEA